jgi:hypothetical protein
MRKVSGEVLIPELCAYSTINVNRLTVLGNVKENRKMRLVDIIQNAESASFVNLINKQTLINNSQHAVNCTMNLKYVQMEHILMNAKMVINVRKRAHQIKIHV